MNSLSSAKSALPLEYYALPFCKPEVIIPSAENLGEVLRGDRIYNSLYQVCDGGFSRFILLRTSPTRFCLTITVSKTADANA